MQLLFSIVEVWLASRSLHCYKWLPVQNAYGTYLVMGLTLWAMAHLKWLGITFSWTRTGRQQVPSSLFITFSWTRERGVLNTRKRKNVPSNFYKVSSNRLNREKERVCILSVHHSLSSRCPSEAKRTVTKQSFFCSSIYNKAEGNWESIVMASSGDGQVLITSKGQHEKATLVHDYYVFESV